MDNNEIPWEYEPYRIGYKLRGQKKTYIPDFYLPEGMKSNSPFYVEIKGYSAEQDKHKIIAIKRKIKNLVVYYRKDLLKLGIIDTSGRVIITPRGKHNGKHW